MSTNSNLDRISKAWLAEGPTQLADRVFDAALDEVHLTRQRRRLPVLWRLNLMPVQLRLAAAALIGVVALGVIYLNLPKRNDVGGPSPSALQSPRSSPEGRAGQFPRPFGYTLPAGEGLVVDVSDDHLLYQFRHPVPSGTGYDRVVAVRAVTGGRADPCSEQPEPLALGGPQAFIDYFKSIPTIEVAGEKSTIVDGLTAIEANLTFQPATTSCPDVWLWTASGSITQSNGRAPTRVTIFDVSGVHVVILTIGPDTFTPKADELISSLTFDANH